VSIDNRFAAKTQTGQNRRHSPVIKQIIYNQCLLLHFSLRNDTCQSNHISNCFFVYHDQKQHVNYFNSFCCHRATL